MTDESDDGSVGGGSLADQLADLDIDAPDREDVSASESSETSGPEASDVEPTHASTTNSAQPDRPTDSHVDTDDDLSDQALFERALSEMSPEDARRAKRPPQSTGRDSPGSVGDVTDSPTLGSKIERSADQEPTTSPNTTEQDERRPPESADTSAREKLTEEELFEQAVAGLDPKDMYQGKFEGRGADLPEEPEASDQDQPPSTTYGNSSADAKSTPERARDEDHARQQIEEIRTRRQFEKAVGPVEQKLERSKYRERSSDRDPQKDVERRIAFRSDSPDELTTPPLPKSGDGLNDVGQLAPAHRDLLERFEKRLRRNEVLEINVRGDTVEDALRQVELFVHQQWKEKASFCRIVHGRGLRSEGPPVLKPAILRWLEGPGFRYIRGYAPEVNNARDYGSLVVELSKRRDN